MGWFNVLMTEVVARMKQGLPVYFSRSEFIISSNAKGACIT